MLKRIGRIQCSETREWDTALGSAGLDEPAAFTWEASMATAHWRRPGALNGASQPTSGPSTAIVWCLGALLQEPNGQSMMCACMHSGWQTLTLPLAGSYSAVLYLDSRRNCSQGGPASENRALHLFSPTANMTSALHDRVREWACR